MKKTNICRPASLRTPSAAAGADCLPGTALHVALGFSAVMLSPAALAAETDANADADARLGTVRVVESALDANPNAEPGVPYKAKYSADERHKRPLAETPQNIKVLTRSQIEDSGYTDLRDILDAQPGITLGTGENGNAFGDRYIIRGQEARSDVFVDGMRDPGMTIRESFATEQVEISKGPSSSFAGRGTTGGAINSVTKQATTQYDFARASAGIGSDDHLRLSLDANKTFSDALALRVNLLHAREDVPDRSPADRKRDGLALSTFWKAGSDLDFTVDYYGMDAEDRPDMGSFLVGAVPDRKPAKKVPVYAQKQDFLKSDVDILTARVRYTLSPELRVTNVTRLGNANNGYVVTGARAGSLGANSPAAGIATTTLSTHQGWQKVDYFVNQTNFHLDQTIAGQLHEFIFGLEYSSHKVLNGVYRVENAEQNCITGNTATSNNGWCLTDGAGRRVSDIGNLMQRRIAKGDWDIDWQVKTTSLSVMDTVDLSPQWTMFGGLRYDRYDFDTTTANVRTRAETRYKYSDELWNGHLGITYKFRPDANVYLSYATSSDINGGESDVGSSCGYGGVCVDALNRVGIADSKPEKTQSVELGTKWNLFGEKLLATAALFHITKSDVMEQAATSTGYDASGSLNTGKNRVRGFEVGLSGMLTPRLSTQAGFTVMESEVLKSNVPARKGRMLSNFAEESAFVQLKYQATDRFAFGAAAKYEGRRYAGQPDTAASFNAEGRYSQPIPSYTVLDLFASYRFNPHTDIRVNVGNVTDKDYYLAAYQSGTFLYKGDARTLRLTLNHDF